MNEHDESARERLSSLSAGMRRIGESLDVQTVLHEPDPDQAQQLSWAKCRRTDVREVTLE